MSKSATQSNAGAGESGSQTANAEPGESNPADDELSLDEIFHLLQSDRRRLVIEHLRGRDDEVVMRDLVEEVAADEYNTSVESLDSTRRQRVYIALYQRHLPKLDDAGVIDYNQNRGIVRRNSLASEVEQRLTMEPTHTTAPTTGGAQATEYESDGNWRQYYLAATVVNLAVIAATVLGFTPAAFASGILVSIVVFSVYLTVVVAQNLATLEFDPTQ